MKAIWDNVAYVARYGHQPLPVILAMTSADVNEMKEALSRIVEREMEK